MTVALRVTHVIPTLGYGGAERQLVNLLRSSDLAVVKHRVVCLGSSAPLAEELRALGVEVDVLGLPGDRPWLSGARRLVPLFRARPSDIVQTWLLDAAVPVFLTRMRSPGGRWIGTFHNTDYEPETIAAASLPNAKVAVLRVIDMVMARIPSAQFVAVSEGVRASVIRRLRVPPDRIEVIHNSIEPSRLDAGVGGGPDVRRRFAIPPEATVVLNIGRLDPQKGQLGLIGAFADATRAHPEAHLVVVGDGPLAAALRREAHGAGIADRFHLVGPQPDIGAWLDGADVFAFPSAFEGFGIALVEAMYAGLACVASRIPVHAEVTGGDGTAVLVPPGDRAALATALAALLDDPGLRAELGASAARHARSHFLSDRMAQQWLALYQRLANRGPWSAGR